MLIRSGDVAAALDDPVLEPPPLDGPGATLALRAAMARFSGRADHATRRAHVEQAIARLDPQRAEMIAHDLTDARLIGDALELTDAIGRVVPTETLATMLGAGDALSEVASDVEAVVRVIGRGEPPSEASDAAANRLQSQFGDHPLGWVTAASMLYQGFDATMWLLAVTIHARARARVTGPGGEPVPAVPAVPRTRRVATAPTRVAGCALATGDAVVLEIGVAGLPYGGGPHRCPGSDLAERIVAGMVAAIERAGFRVDLDRVVADGDGRPTAVPLVRA